MGRALIQKLKLKAGTIAAINSSMDILDEFTRFQEQRKTNIEYLRGLLAGTGALPLLLTSIGASAGLSRLIYSA
jgi:hypothetical protein